jgi:hypothetical protein
MKNIVALLLLMALLCSCVRMDKKIISKIERECSITFDHTTNGVGAEVYRTYTNEDVVYKYGEKAKNIIDKYLNILPDRKSDLEHSPIESGLVSSYHWETPKIEVELFYVYAKNLSKIKVYIVNK